MYEMSMMVCHIFSSVCQVTYVKGTQAAPIPGPQGPPGTPVSVHDLAVVLLIISLKCILYFMT